MSSLDEDFFKALDAVRKSKGKTLKWKKVAEIPPTWEAIAEKGGSVYFGTIEKEGPRNFEIKANLVVDDPYARKDTGMELRRMRAETLTEAKGEFSAWLAKRKTLDPYGRQL